MEFSLGSFLIGLFLGWGVEWIIDRLYWRGLSSKDQYDNAFKTELASLKDRFDDSQVRIDEYRAKNEEQEGEIKALRSHLSEAMPPDSAELFEKLRAANAEIALLKMAVPETSTDNSLARELAEAKAMIERLQSENNTSPIIALNELQAKLDEAESELSGYRSVEEITKIEIQELRKKLSEAEAKANGKGKNGASSEELASLRAEILAKDEEIFNLRNAGIGGGDDQELRTKASQADYFARQLENARATIATLEQEMLRPVAPAPAAQDEESKRKVSELQDQVSRLMSTLDAKNEELSLLQNQLLDRERSLQGMASFEELADARRRADEAEEKVTSLMSQSMQGTEELDALRRQIEARGAQEDTTASLRQEIEDLSAKLASRDQQVSESRSEFNAVNARLHTAQAELEDLRSARSARDSEVQALREEVANMRDALGERQELEAKLKEAEIELEAYNDLKASKDQLQNRVGLLEGELAEARAQAKDAELAEKTREAELFAAEVAQLRAHLEHHRTALANALAQFEQGPMVSSSPAPTPTPTPVIAPPVADQPVESSIDERDPLEKIQGIGFVYERKLWDAGILTFEDLANSTPDEVTAAIAPEEWQEIDPASWIAAAKKLIGG